ncbi:MAG: N-acetylmuramoyl-L-alanine amidase [Bacteroidales bacterium]|nr:N-acetylmuramoyl-L-alanine amidase [Bacteroidales bacterium]
MRKLLPALLLLFLITPSLLAQPRPRDFREANDSLQQRLKRRTGVDNTFRLERVTPRGNVLDFYYSVNLGSYPWRPGDVTWFRDQLGQLASSALGTYKVGSVYAQRQNIADLPIPSIGNDGKAVANKFKVADPRGKTPPLVRGDDVWLNGLSGRHIALWQSHGRYWEESTQRWEWQRSATHRTIEDLYTQSYVIPFLMPMLENAGAVVLSPKERDPQTWEVVCDNDESFSGPREHGLRRAGKYEEKGPWSPAGEGFADAREQYKEADNPFRMGSARMVAGTDGEATAQALWRPDIPEKGEYAVYVSYKTLPGSTTDARYTIHHLGGETLRHVNQQMAGGTWVYLGTFPFDKGKDGFVSLSNHSSDGGVVSADAVRFGGGMGKVEREGTLSGFPAYVEGAVYNFQYAGMDMSLLDKWEGDYKKDLSARGVWVNEISGGSRVNPDAPGRRVPLDLALAFHSDAGTTPSDSIVGTLTIYTLRSEGKEEFPNGESRLTSRLLADWVQSQVVDDIRAQFDPAWSRRDIRDRSYSESRLPQVPSMILELLAHQNFADMRYGLDPGFRFTVSRSVYKGILKYLSARYGCPYVVQPLPVHGFRVALEEGKAVLRWQATEDSLEPTATPDYYKVYIREDDGAFGEGYQIQDTTCTLPLKSGHVYSYRITACNTGGESFPSETLAAGIASDQARQVLIVNNFTRVAPPSWFDTPTYAGFNDRLDSGVPWGSDILLAGSVYQFDRSQPWTDDDNPGFGGSFTDMAGSQIAGNTFDFVALHGKAILEAGFNFSSSSLEAFDGTSNAYALDLICGKQVTTRIGHGPVPDRYSVFPEGLQQALRTFTAAGGNIILSGSYIGTDAWDTVYQGVPKAPESTRSFIKQVLGYQWVTNFGDYSAIAQPYAGSGLPTVSYNRAWSPLMYRVDNADGIAPAGKDSRILMRYQGTDIPAATLYNAEGYQVVAFGFPLETSAQMDALIKSVLSLFR